MSLANNGLDVEELRRTVTGEVITDHDEGFESARRLFYGGVGSRPAALVRVADAADVATVVTHVSDAATELAVRSGGHSIAGHGSAEGGVVIDVRGLRTLAIDVDARTAWAGTGFTAAEMTNALAEHGLAVGFGDSGSVGIGGITLGGGVGFLSRKHGLTVDSLLAAELVTAQGEILTVDAESHPDLFWAIRGGGGNFGVATRFKYSLAPVDRVVGGLIILPATVETIAGFISESQAAADELSTICNVMTCPPMPFVPESVVGKTVILGLVMWCGDVEEGHRVMDRFRALGEPLADMLDEMAYPEIYMPEEEDFQPLVAALTGFSSGIDEGEISTSLEAIEASDAPMRAVQVRVLGGAISRVPAEATAYAHRDRPMMVNVAAFYEEEGQRQSRWTWVENLAKTLTDGDNAGYVGFLADEGPDRVRAAYPGETWERLRRVKAAYDPDNLFRRNQNIPPAM